MRELLPPSLHCSQTDGRRRRVAGRGLRAGFDGSRLTRRDDPQLSLFDRPEPLWTAYCDGASRGNPGPASYGVVICAPDGAILAEIGATLGRDTNQAAEYQALIRALAELRARGARRVNIFTDSQFVTRQFTGEYKVRDARMRAYLDQVRELQGAFAEVTVTHILRSSHAHNVRADKLANRALDDAARHR